MENPPPYAEFDGLDLKDFEMQSSEDTLSLGTHGLVIGIDFGTTFSGIAYAFPQNPNEITVLKEWEDKYRRNYSDKVPSEISYAQHDVSSVTSQKVGYSWGFKAKQDPNRLKWFKLCLDPQQNFRISGLSAIVNNFNTAIPEDKDAMAVVKDYLVGLRRHLKAHLTSRFGPHFFDDYSKLYVFTMPAIWSDKVKSQMAKAVKMAGFAKEDNGDKIHYMSEPEAAAIDCLKAIQPSLVQVGDNIIIADCGGGTVDLVSYHVHDLAPLQVSEAAVGEGGICGSIFVNGAFEEFMAETLGRETYKNLNPKSREAMLKGFEEEVKHQFSNDPEQELFSVGVPGVPDSADGSIEMGFLALSRWNIVEMFQPVLRQIIALVRRQKIAIESGGGTLKALLLVGGFSSSPYLYNFFKEWARDNGNFHVLQPHNALTSIVRGAVMHGLQSEMNVDSVTTRRARKYYGVSFNEPFVEGMHPEEYRYWESKRNEYYCSNRLKWFIHKGAEISEEEPIDASFARDLWRHEYFNRKNHVFVDRLLVYDGENPPDCSDHPDINIVGILKSDLRSAPLMAWERQNHGTSEDFMTIEYDLKMTVHGALLDFELWCEDKGYGKVSID